MPYNSLTVPLNILNNENNKHNMDKNVIRVRNEFFVNIFIIIFIIYLTLIIYPNK